MPIALIVDDEEAIRCVLKLVCMAENYECDEVENGSSALALMKEKSYDVIFLDLNMPEMDGTDVLQAYREISTKRNVVVISGRLSEDDAVTLSRHPRVNEVLLKPFRTDRIREVLSRLGYRSTDC